MKARERTQNGKDFAIIFAIVIAIIVVFGSLVLNSKYECISTQVDCARDAPWYAEQPILNIAVAVPAAALLGWFVGLSIPVTDPKPLDRGFASYCPRCRKKIERGDHFCASCGLPFAT